MNKLLPRKLTILISVVCVSCASNERFERPKIRSCEQLDVAYRDICQLYELKIKNILKLRENNKITNEQAEIMIANAYNWAATAASERFYQIR
jgi:hypothetical protein